MATWGEFKNIMQPRESGGDYNALFSYANRPNGQFAGTNLTNMSIDQLLDFSNPSGPYAQFVKGKVGRVATPMGANQIVGATLRDAKSALGLSGQEKFTPEMQDSIGEWIYKTQGPNAWASMTTKGRPDMEPLAQPTAATYDPINNLSKSQRMMLAFGALRDAGSALTGQQGNAFSTTMTGINQQQDMVRKMQAEQAQLAQDATNKARIDALLMGGSPTQSIGGGQQIGGVAPIPQVPDVASLDAQINQLRSQGGAYMASGLTAEYSAKLEDLMNQRNELKTTTEASALKSEEFAAKKQKTSSAIKVAQKALSAALGVKPEDVDKVIASGDPLDSSSFWFSRLPLGSMGESQEFKDYANYTKQLSTIMTFENLGEIIKSGVKLGTMTDADFELIGGLSGILDPQSDPEGTATRIADAYTKLTNTLKAMEAEDAGTSSKPNATRPMPKIGDIVDGHRFKGGSVTSQSSWEKI